MDEIQDFERDIRDSFGGLGFMADADFASHRDAAGVFDPFAVPSAGASAELDALAAYFATFDQVPRSPFRNPDGSFTSDALLGREVFVKAGCGACHAPPEYTDSTMDGGLHDVGTILPTSGFRLGGPLTGIDTPTLKGIWQSAPYLHDGRAATLMEIFTTYTKDQMGTVSNLTEAELGQMVRYLQELDDVPETVAPLQPDPMEPLTPMNPLGGSSPSSSNACSLPRASVPSRPGAWVLAVGMAWAARSRRRRRARHP